MAFAATVGKKIGCVKQHSRARIALLFERIVCLFCCYFATRSSFAVDSWYLSSAEGMPVNSMRMSDSP